MPDCPKGCIGQSGYLHGLPAVMRRLTKQGGIFVQLNNRIKAAKIGYIMISILLCVLGIVLIAVPDFSVTLLGRLGG